MQEPESGFDTDLSRRRAHLVTRSKWETYSSSKQSKIIDQVRASFKAKYGPQPMLYALGDHLLPRIQRALNTCKLYEPLPPESLAAQHWIDQAETFYDRTEKWMIACRELGKTSLANERAFSNNLVQLASRAYECLSAAQGVQRIGYLLEKHLPTEIDLMNDHSRYLCESPHESVDGLLNMPLHADQDAGDSNYELLRLLASSEDVGESWWRIVTYSSLRHYLYYVGGSLHRLQDDTLYDWAEYARSSSVRQSRAAQLIFQPLSSDHVDSRTWHRAIRKLIEMGYMGWALCSLEPAMIPDAPKIERSTELNECRRALRVLRASLKYVDRPGLLDVHELVLLLNAEGIRTSGQGKAWTARNLLHQPDNDSAAGFDWGNEGLQFDSKLKGNKRGKYLFSYPAVRARLLSL